MKFLESHDSPTSTLVMTARPDPQSILCSNQRKLRLNDENDLTLNDRVIAEAIYELLYCPPPDFERGEAQMLANYLCIQ
jgi:hypothetical protein